jgi:hypothetical protein
MPVLHFDLSEYPGYLAKLGQVRLTTAAKRGALSAALRAVSMMQTKTDHAPSSDPGGKGTGGAFNTGRFKASWKGSPADDGAFLFNEAPYAGVIEYGRRPGARMPPLAPIAQWAQRRLGLSEGDARAAAYLIARAIARRGLKARMILNASIKELGDMAAEEISREFGKELGMP